MSEQKQALKSLSIACRVVLDMHALNNEGSESNRLMTRQVGVVVPSQRKDEAESASVMDRYERHVVNAVSGDMNKHIFSAAFRNIAADRGLPMSPASQALDPARINGDEDFRAWMDEQGKDVLVSDVINRLLSCSLTDVCGLLITGSGVSVKRKSAVEFGWTVGLPEITEVEEFLHARHAITRLKRTRVERGASAEDKAAAQKEREANTGQMVFNRPASSGVYAFVAHLDVAAIGFNDAAQAYPQNVSDPVGTDTPVDRPERLRASLLALAQTLLHPKGALTSTQLPHVVDLEGYVSVSSSAAAAPLLSPLTDDYIERTRKTAAMLNRLHASDNAVQVADFNGGDGLLEALGYVMDNYSPGMYFARAQE
jgi:CRISPR-associated protein Cst2